MRRLPALILSAALAVGLVSGAAAADAAPARSAVPAGKADARVLLRHLTVRADSHAASYARSKFKVWVDADRDGLNTRAEVLKAESRTTASVNRHGTVKGGRWISRYDNRVVTKATRLDVDHLVPLAEAWRSGAWTWSADRRQAFGNDLGYGPSLIAVTLSSNRSKGDDDPARWMPPASSYACTYVKQWIAVKSRWHLSVDRAEKTALTAGIAGCATPWVAKPGKPRIAALVVRARPVVKPSPLPDPAATGSTSLPAPKPSSTSTPAPSPVPSWTPTSTPVATEPTGSVYYKNCDAVRAAGKAPLHRGQPGYATPRLDRDGDGVACE